MSKGRGVRGVGPRSISLFVHHHYLSGSPETTRAQETAMQDEVPTPERELDEDTLAFAQLVFQQARAGDAQGLGQLLGMGLPPNLRNEKGDSLLMLASYHGHVEA